MNLVIIIIIAFMFSIGIATGDIFNGNFKKKNLNV
jgi:hypothetical protein